MYKQIPFKNKSLIRNVAKSIKIDLILTGITQLDALINCAGTFYFSLTKNSLK